MSERNQTQIGEETTSILEAHNVRKKSFFGGEGEETSSWMVKFGVAQGDEAVQKEIQCQVLIVKENR